MSAFLEWIYALFGIKKTIGPTPAPVLSPSTPVPTPVLAPVSSPSTPPPAPAPVMPASSPSPQRTPLPTQVPSSLPTSCTDGSIVKVGSRIRLVVENAFPRDSPSYERSNVQCLPNGDIGTTKEKGTTFDIVGVSQRRGAPLKPEDEFYLAVTGCGNPVSGIGGDAALRINTETGKLFWPAPGSRKGLSGSLFRVRFTANPQGITDSFSDPRVYTTEIIYGTPFRLRVPQEQKDTRLDVSFVTCDTICKYEYGQRVVSLPIAKVTEWGAVPVDASQLQYFMFQCE